MKFVLRKVGSYAFDYILTMLFVMTFSFCANVFNLDPATKTKGYMMVICALIMVLFFTTYVPTSTNGQTIGMKIFHLRVVNKNQKDRTYWQSFIRECVVKISAAPFFVIFTAIYYAIYAIGKRTWDIEMPLDFLLKTEVVDENLPKRKKRKKK